MVSHSAASRRILIVSIPPIPPVVPRLAPGIRSVPTSTKQRPVKMEPRHIVRVGCQHSYVGLIMHREGMESYRMGFN